MKLAEILNQMKKSESSANKALVIAVDGPAASGKGTLAKKIAEYFDLAHLDTGKLYRFVGYKLLEQGINPENIKEGKNLEFATKAARNIKLQDLTSTNLSSEDIGKAASIVSAIPEIRKALLDFQRKIAKSSKGAVLDGRDIGTVICPDADYKFFITANIEARAKRRYKELQNKGSAVIYTSVLKDLEERDERDLRRKISPLVPAEGAIYIDTTNLDVDTVFEKVISLINP